MKLFSKENFIRISRAAVSFTDKILNLCVIVILLALLAFGSYALWDSKQVHTAASSTAYEIYKPASENPRSLHELMAINPDAVGWITLYGTGIDYPLVQGEDNRKYINTSATGEFSLAGAIFLDYKASRDFSDFCTLIHGHNMAENAMFGQISDFADPEFFESHPYGSLFYNGKEHGLHVVEYFQTDAYDLAVYDRRPTGEEEESEMLDYIRSLAIRQRETDLLAGERFVLLSTCSTGFTNARDLLLAVITEEPRPDPFAEPKETRIQPFHPTERLQTENQAWIPVSLITLLLILLRLLLAGNIKRKNRKNSERC